MLMIALAALIYKLRGVIFLLLLSLLFAYLVGPIVDMADRITPVRLPRRVVLPIIYIAVLGLIVAGFVEVGTRLVVEANHLNEQMPAFQQKVDRYISDPLPSAWGPWQRRAVMFLREQLIEGSERLLPMAKNLGMRALSSVGGILSYLVVPVFAFFFLLQGRTLVDSFLGALSPQDRNFTHGILDEIDQCLGGYMRSLMLLAFITFVVYLIIFTLMGVPYALLLAVLGGVLDFVPVVGPLIAIVATLTVSAFDGQVKIAALFALLCAYRLTQDYVIQPRIYAHGLKLNPLLILLGAFAGEHLAGVAGMLLSVPVMAVLKIIIGRVLP